MFQNVLNQMPYANAIYDLVSRRDIFELEARHRNEICKLHGEHQAHIAEIEKDHDTEMHIAKNSAELVDAKHTYDLEEQKKENLLLQEQVRNLKAEGVDRERHISVLWDMGKGEEEEANALRDRVDILQEEVRFWKAQAEARERHVNVLRDTVNALGARLHGLQMFGPAME